MLNRNVVSLLGLYVIISLQLFTLPSLNAQEKIHGKLVKTGLWEGRQVEFLQGEIAIILRSGVSNKDISPLLEGLGATIRRDFDELGFGVIELPADVDILSVASDLKENELIKVAEPNMVVRAHWEPDDDYYQDGHQWALKNTSQSPPNGTYDADIDAQEAWDISRGNSTVIIAILDSGIPILSGNLSHTDLNLSTKFILGPDYIDDPSDGVKDMHGHGTHVTGIASAETDNSAGIAGVAGNCRVMVIQVFNQNLGGSWEAFLDGVRYAVDNGAKIINYSGGQTSPSGLAEEAVQYANDPDNYALIIASSGNDNDPLEWPAAYSSSYSNVIAVGATQHHDQKASYSNHGSGLNVVAPGGYGGSPSSNDIYSTTPNYIVEINYDDVSQLYGYLAGTSMAAPHVSGVAALILSINPSLTPSEVRQIIEESADKVPGMNGENFTNEYGYGRVNAYKALLGTNGFTFVSGIIESSVTWSGGVYVTGDVFVNPGVTLTVDPGTEILFDARRDDQHSGNETEKCELIVDGTLVVNGTQSQQVKFRSSTASSPSRWDWASITFRNGATASISNARISDTQYGIVANYASSIDIDNVEIYNVTGKCIELIECDNASITNSEVYDATNHGIFIRIPYNKSAYVADNKIYDTRGGIVVDYGTGVIDIHRNYIFQNTWYGVYVNQKRAYIERNTIVNNTNGVWVKDGNQDGWEIDLRNNIIASNNLPGENNDHYGIYASGNDDPVVSFCDVWDNSGGNYVSMDVPHSSYGNISEDPLFDSNHHLTWANYPIDDNTKSPCIDTGTPIYTDPDGTVSDIGVFYFDQMPPSAPTNLVLSIVGSHPYLQWDASSEYDVVSYNVYRKRIGMDNDYVLRASVSVPATDYTDYGIFTSRRGDRVYYYVTAVDITVKESSASNIVYTIYQQPQWRTNNANIPDQFALKPNYPNPFNPVTTIHYDLPEASYVSLVVYDILGREVLTLLENREEAGFKSVVWDGKDNSGNIASAGIYIYMLRAWSQESEKTYKKTCKMVLLQ